DKPCALLAGDFEVAFYVVVAPGSDDRAVVQTQIFDVTIDNVVKGATGSILRLGFEMDKPAFGFKRGFLNRDRPWTGVQNAGDLLSIPVHNDCDLVPIVRVRPPVADPTTLQRMSLLGGHGHKGGQI